MHQFDVEIAFDIETVVCLETLKEETNRRSISEVRIIIGREYFQLHYPIEQGIASCDQALFIDPSRGFTQRLLLGTLGPAAIGHSIRLPKNL